MKDDGNGKDEEWSSHIIYPGVDMPSPEVEQAIRDEEALSAWLDDANNNDSTEGPPNTVPIMFPEPLGSMVRECCAHSEAVPVAVMLNLLMRFSACIGPMAHLLLGDEKRFLNDYVLVVGPSGQGKGSSNHGPARIYARAEEQLASLFDQRYQKGQGEGLNTFPNLAIHTGGLSSGEGLAAALDDGTEGSDEAVTDKRLLVFEYEFAQCMANAQRRGSTISMVLRNAYDGGDIKPLTKRDKVSVTSPYLCLLGNVTAEELADHEQTRMMSMNGMLNRFLICWQQPTKLVPFPKPIPDATLNEMGQLLADRIQYARGCHFETHYKKMDSLSRSVTLGEDAKAIWSEAYARLMNRADCPQVSALSRRHRLHGLILASLFALLDCRHEINANDINSALAWCDYSHDSISYSFNAMRDQAVYQRCESLSFILLKAIAEITKQQAECTASDLYHWFSGRIKQCQLTPALEMLMTRIPPMVSNRKVIYGRGRPKLVYQLTEHSISQMRLDYEFR